MELKIFETGFSVDEFNEFINSNVVHKMHFLENGGIYVMWQAPNKLGFSPIEKVEALNGVVKKAEAEIMGAEVDRTTKSGQIADLKEQIADFHPNQDQYKNLDAEITQAERQIKMSDETIALRQITITDAKMKAQEVLNAA